jgi:hypothetical protein
MQYNIYNIKIDVNYIFILYTFGIMDVDFFLYYLSNLIKFDFD